MSASPQFFKTIAEAADYLFHALGDNLKVAAPLGLGKPNGLLNLIYRRAKHDPSIQLALYTALSLNPPRASSDLGRRFFEPFRKRHWGEEYPDLEYARDAIRGALPPNVRVHEFYMQAGAALGSPGLQGDYQSINYTHVAQAVHRSEVQAIVQLVSRDTRSGKARYSLSCNPDLTLDLADLYRKNDKRLLIVAVIHPDLPFLGGEAEVCAEFFDAVVDDPTQNYRLFALPRLPIPEADQCIGFYASQLVADEGTLQIGIGSLSDALVASLILRQRDNALYYGLVERAWQGREKPAGLLETAPLKHGLYGLSEMVMDGFMHLRRAGILKRCVQDEKSGTKTYLHGAFFLGSAEFYDWLRGLKDEDFDGLRMGRVSKVNDLYDPHELVLRLQRKNPRFFNTCMKVTLLGGAASDTLEDGRVVSGVGGQFNFVSMSHELHNSRSCLMLRSWRPDGTKRASNLVWSHGHLTIPRHLRDIVITEYGIADIRSRTDEEVIQRLLNITDSEFQEELLETAKKCGKIARNYRVPDSARSNTPAKVQAFIEEGREKGVFSVFPLGSDFTPEEERLVVALEKLQATSRSKKQMAEWLLKSLKVKAATYTKELDRMDLTTPKTMTEKFSRLMLLAALAD